MEIIIELMNGRIKKVYGVPPGYVVTVHDYDHLGLAEPYALKLYDPAREVQHTIEHPEQTDEPFNYQEY